MRVVVSVHTLPKAGNRPEEYEDAAYPAVDGCHTGARFRTAVADGATETSFAGLWANLLVESFGTGRLSMRRPEPELARLGRHWRCEIGSRPLPWYAEEKVRQGAFAALTGLSLRETRDGLRWEAMAAGDSCLFHRRKGALLAAFPLRHAADFTSRPHLLSTQPERNRPFGRRSGRAQAGDRFLLATDALACCLLRAEEEGESLWPETPPADFDDWIEGLRARGLRNDDMTLVMVEIEPDGELADPAGL